MKLHTAALSFVLELANTKGIHNRMHRDQSLMPLNTEVQTERRIQTF